ncbi:MAG: hypothetical protein BroJett015_46900 [Chloroflexota bacterium]|nr:MAG: hypothetical protein BroJett015_46900 [Chloroflexota bacterium]
MLFGLVSRSEAKKSSDVDFVGKRSDLTSLLPEAVAAIQAQKLVKSLEELNGYLCRCLQVTAYI